MFSEREREKLALTSSSGTVTGLVGGDVARVGGSVGERGVERDDVADMAAQHEVEVATTSMR